jgi:hypothetical protein
MLDFVFRVGKVMVECYHYVDPKTFCRVQLGSGSDLNRRMRLTVAREAKAL